MPGNWFVAGITCARPLVNLPEEGAASQPRHWTDFLYMIVGLAASRRIVPARGDLNDVDIVVSQVPGPTLGEVLAKAELSRYQ